MRSKISSPHSEISAVGIILIHLSFLPKGHDLRSAETVSKPVFRHMYAWLEK